MIYGVSRQVARSRITGPPKSPKQVERFVLFSPRNLYGSKWGNIFIRVEKTSAFQTQVKCLFLRRVTRFDSVLLILCSQIEFKPREKKTKSKFCPFLCQREVLYDFYLHPECSLEKNMTFGSV
jgi:hypothetical protein